MFEKNKIYRDHTGNFLCECVYPSPIEAETMKIRIMAPAREFNFMCEVYSRGNKLILAAPTQAETAKLVEYLNWLIVQSGF